MFLLACLLVSSTGLMKQLANKQVEVTSLLMSAVSQKLKSEDVIYTASGMSLLSHAKPKDYPWLN